MNEAEPLFAVGSPSVVNKLELVRVSMGTNEVKALSIVDNISLVRELWPVERLSLLEVLSLGKGVLIGGRLLVEEMSPKEALSINETLGLGEKLLIEGL